MSWIPPSDQEMFDKAALGIAGQGYEPAWDKEQSVCVILTAGGRRCALGHCVTDAIVGKTWSPQWTALSRTYLGCILAYAHDNLLVQDGREGWLRRMSEIALECGLDDSVLYFQEVR